MAAKMTKANPLNGMHTAGIYSDMTVDGPEIGTLVVIVDRAKNLPNRKSIGKQDPYCAARLGKEAKKTETDRRGGQTPKWDQELRFTVHDSPDYYQMKVSVFNDDKKTDLIGETWVNLQEVVVPGGGQNDLWHNLNYKGKYAGEIRIEITYYDSRPKQEKASDKMRQNAPSGGVDGPRDSMNGPRQPKPPMKRRPLPSDPTSTSPSLTATPNHIHTSQRGYQDSPTYIHTQSPLQAVEHNIPPQRLSQPQQGYGQSHTGMDGYGTPLGITAVKSTGRPTQDDRYEIYDPSGDHDVSNGGHQSWYEDHIEDQRADPRFRYGRHEVASELPARVEYGSPPSPGGLPPPPPAHRSSHASPPVSTPSSNGGYDSQPIAVRNSQYDPPQQDAFRHSMPTYGHVNSYQAYSSPGIQEVQAPYPQASHSNGNGYQKSPPRHHSYDDRYNGDYRSMQPTVEDDQSSPSVPYPSSHRHSEPHVLHYDDPRYDHVSAPAPLNLSGLESASSGHYSPSGASNQQLYTDPPSRISPVSYRDPSYVGSDVSSRTSYNQHSQQSQKSQNQRRQSEDQMACLPGGYVPALPPTLTAGMDPVIAQQVSERIYSENRASYNQDSVITPRSRYPDQPQYQQSYSHPLRQQETSMPSVPAASTPSSVPFAPPAATFDERQSRIATGTYTPIVKPRAISPDPRVPTRKSISPSPVPSPEGCQLSGVPFGPEAYDALNPNVGAAAPAAHSHSTANSNVQIRPSQHDEFKPGAKIIMHDGREVDPSDHLPEASWAPEPEARGSKQSDTSRGRPSPSGAQPMPGSGPRPLRQAGRPHSMSAASASPMYPTGGPAESPTAVSGRKRLQKKSNLNYPVPAPQSSPLAPVSSCQDNSFASSGLPRTHTMDFAGENGYGSYSSSNGGSHGSHGRNSSSVLPPRPAKVPINHGPPPLPPTENAWALLEEMKSIDLGSGRARRRGYENHAIG